MAGEAMTGEAATRESAIGESAIGESATGGVVIVGAGLGGVRVAENLRDGGYLGPITMIGAEDHPPYDRPPLSKTVLTGASERVDLKPSSFYPERQIAVRSGTPVTAIDTDARTVTLGGTGRGEGGAGEVVRYGRLVLSPGLIPRTLPDTGELAGVHVLRTIEQAYSLRDAAHGADHAVVVGAGFIGCEVAASLHELGVPVTVVEPASTPLAAALGPTIGAIIARLHTDAGIDVRTGVGVRGLAAADGRVTGVELTDGSLVAADLVVVGIGGDPHVSFLGGSAIDLAPRELGGGIACDTRGRTSAAGVHALGDAANWGDGGRRVEHWSHTVDQAAVVAADILGAAPPAPTVPYFWSDQHGLKIQLLGTPAPDDQVHLVDDDGRRFLAYYSRDGVLTGVVGAGRAGKLMKTRPLLTGTTPIADVLGS